MKKQLAMVIDSSKCIDCKGCVISCKVQNEVPRGYSRNWIKTDSPDFSDPDRMSKNVTSHYQPGGCMHCEKPICVDACPTGATFKDLENGVVAVNEKLCIGCSNCVAACPYGARFRHPTKYVVDKCDFCESRRAKDRLPACVDTCPTKARVFGDINDPSTEVARLFKENRTVQVVNRKSNTQPHMYYISATAPDDWPVEVSAPAAIGLWEKAGRPLVMAATGLNALAVAAMLGRQFMDRKEKVRRENGKTQEDQHE